MSENQTGLSDDLGDFLSMFSGPSVTPNTDSRNFWNDLAIVQGANTLGYIVLGAGLEEELKPPGQNNGGLRYCSVKRSGMQWTLTAATTRQSPTDVSIYWMPWLRGETVYAQRSWYENSVCEYFLTSQLSGCRFVLTKHQVLHIASTAKGAPSGSMGSHLRTQAENEVTGGTRSRRFSINGGDEGYKHYALAFGIKREGIWSYKALRYGSSNMGEWVTLIAP